VVQFEILKRSPLASRQNVKLTVGPRKQFWNLPSKPLPRSSFSIYIDLEGTPELLLGQSWLDCGGMTPSPLNNGGSHSIIIYRGLNAGTLAASRLSEP
jgi:hypothetical protein